jgi:hypothetical protein
VTSVREAGAKLINQFVVPYKGTWRGVSANSISNDALFDSLNVFIRKGKIRQRPGLLLLNNSIFGASVIGGAMAVTPTEKVLLAVTNNTLYTLRSTDTAWVLDTSIAFGADIVDTTFLETASQYVAIFANTSLPLKRWLSGSGVTAITASVGTVPSAKSVCTAARRIIALVEPHTLVWTATLTYDNWPVLATAKIAQTNDVGVCIRSLGTLDFVVYKERSIYLAKAQAGSDAGAFAIQFVQRVEGPAGVHAVVDVGGMHMYMTKNGRVGVFDGSSYVRWLIDGLWLFLQTDIDITNAHRIVGIFDYRLHTVTFHYPRTTDVSGQMTGMVIINLPLEGSGIDSPSAFLGVSSKPISYGYEMRFNNQIDRSLLFTSTPTDQQSFVFDENTTQDDGAVFDCMMQTGLLPLPDMVHQQVSIETFFERSDAYGYVNVYPVTSNSLESEGGLFDRQVRNIVDLNVDPISEYVGFNLPCRFFGLRYEWVSDATVRYAGAMLYGRVVS